MAQVYIDINTRASLQGFQQLDDAQRQQLIELAKLQREYKNAEAATARFATTAAASHQRAAASALALDRTQKQLSDTYTRRISLRHGADHVITPEQRQILRQVRDQGGEAQQWSGYTRDLVASGQEIERLRSARAAELWQKRKVKRENDSREEKERERRAFMDEVFAENLRHREEDAAMSARNGAAIDRRTQELIRIRRDRIKKRNRLLQDREAKELSDWEQTIGAGMMGDSVINTAMLGLGGGADESVLRRRARLRVARNIRRTPELAGKVTADEFETMTSAMAQKMEATAATAMSGLMASIAGATAVFSLGGAVGSFDKERKSTALERLIEQSGSRKELRQLSENYYENKGMIGYADQLRLRAGISADEANRTIFAASSAGVLGNETVGIATDAKAINLDPSVAFAAIQKVRSNFGDAAGTQREIMGKLLIAAKDSPQDVGGVAAALGTAASAFQGIGGNADDMLSMLGVLSGPTRNVEGAADRIKSVSEQISKYMGRIAFDGQPLEGIALIDALPRLEREGRLRSENGKEAVSIDKFLSERQAVSAFQDIQRQRGMIGASATRMGDKADAGTLLSRRANLPDVAMQVVDARNSAVQFRQQAEEKAFAKWEGLADAIEEEHKGKLVNEGDTNGWFAYGRDKLNDAQRSSTFGLGARGYAMQQLYQGNVHSQKTREALFATITEDMDAGTLRATMLQAQQGKMKVGGMVGTTGTFIDIFNPLYQAQKLGTIPRQERAATKDEADAMAAVAQRKLDAMKYEPVKQQISGVFDRTFKVLPGGMRDQLGAAGNDIASKAQLFGNAADFFARDSGFSPDDYRVKIYRQVAEEKKNEALANPGQLAASLIPFADKGKANEAVYTKLQEIGGEADERTYKANLQMIDEAEAAAGNDLAGAEKGTARYDRAEARMKGIKSLKRNAKSSGGRIDAMEAQDIVDKIQGGGDSGAQKQMVDLLNKIVTELTKASGAVAQVATNTKKDKPGDKKLPSGSMGRNKPQRGAITVP